LGIKKLFTDQSQFYPLQSTSPLQVSSATQQTVLEVNEKGSIGASVNRFSVTALSVQMPIQEVNFVVDRPFVAVIVNRLYRMPYFIAKVTNPNA
jgi:serine protease inhibitor